MDRAFSDLRKKGQPGSVVLNVSTYQAVGPRFCLLDRVSQTQSLHKHFLLINLVFKHRARGATFAELAMDPDSDVRVKADVLRARDDVNAIATADVHISGGPGFGRVGAAYTASAVLPTSQDALWKTRAATSQQVRVSF